MTRVIAHRTTMRDARENSLAGIEAAARLGADVVELDTRRARDGQAVLLHDPWLVRVQHVPLGLRWTPSAWLPRFGIPTLSEALSAARAHDLMVAIDTKDSGAADAVVAAVTETGMQDNVLLWSQHMPAVRTFVRALPETEAALLRDTFDPVAHERLLADAAAIGAHAVSAHQDAVTPEYIAAAAARDLRVYCWYQRLNLQEQRLAANAAAGLAGVVSDWPAAARHLLDGGDPSP